jgi:hypothetical protein
VAFSMHGSSCHVKCINWSCYQAHCSSADNPDSVHYSCVLPPLGHARPGTIVVVRLNEHEYREGLLKSYVNFSRLLRLCVGVQRQDALRAFAWDVESRPATTSVWLFYPASEVNIHFRRVEG